MAFQRREGVDRLVSPPACHHPGFGRDGMLAQAGDGLGKGLIGGQVAVNKPEKFDGGLVAVSSGLAQEQHRQGGNPFAQVRAG